MVTMERPPRDKDETQLILNKIGLPPWFSWQDKPVLPSYRISAFGKWLRETPYHRGLFAACHDALTRHWDEIDTADDLAEVVDRMQQLKAAEYLPGMAPQTQPPSHADQNQQ